MSDQALLLAAALLLPVLGAICYFDVRYLRIPNPLVLGALAVFVATGSWGLPLDVFLMRLGYGVAVLAAGFALYQVAAGVVGAGDLKLMAALAPFLSGATVGPFLLGYMVFSVVGLMVLKAIRARAGEGPHGLRALNEDGHFPAGVVIALSMLVALGLEIAGRFL